MKIKHIVLISLVLSVSLLLVIFQREMFDLLPDSNFKAYVRFYLNRSEFVNLFDELEEGSYEGYFWDDVPEQERGFSLETVRNEADLSLEEIAYYRQQETIFRGYDLDEELDVATRNSWLPVLIAGNNSHGWEVDMRGEYRCDTDRCGLKILRHNGLTPLSGCDETEWDNTFMVRCYNEIEEPWYWLRIRYGYLTEEF